MKLTITHNCNTTLEAFTDNSPPSTSGLLVESYSMHAYHCNNKERCKEQLKVVSYCIEKFLHMLLTGLKSKEYI